MKPPAASRQLPAAIPALLVFVLALPVSAAAQAMVDPTRPPGGQSVESPQPQPTGDGGMTLQSVLISPSQKAAIISGVMVKLGEKYGDAVLVKVAESEVVLQSGAESQVLKLYPGVEKRESNPAQKPRLKPAGAKGSAP
jgi:MSHA biogenesis protein MshK